MSRSKRLWLWLLCAAACLPAQAQIPTVDQNGLVNAATGRSASSIPVTARGSIVSIFGKNLTSVTLAANAFPLPKELGGVQVLFGNIPAALLYVSPSQINAQVPFELPDVSAVDLVVQNGSGNSAALVVTLLAQDPGIFVTTHSGIPVSPANPVSAGESITIWATGLGAVLPPVPTGEPGPSSPPAVAAITPVVKVGGRPVNVNFAIFAPGRVIYEISATAPADLVAPTSEVTVEDGVIPAVTGPPGPIGPAGATGSAGLPGAAGAAGAVGARGSTGAPGAQGSIGLTGSAGPAGTAGPRGLTWRGAWSNTTAYAVNDAVQFNGTSYINLQAGTGREPDTSPTFWSLLAHAGATGTAGTNGVNGSAGTAGTNGTNGLNGLPGAQGIAGPQGLTWQGTWSNTTAYAVNDAVQFNGTSYINLQAGTGHEPDTSPTFWSLLAHAGATGTDGTNGVNGSPGTAGTNGTNGLNGLPGAQGIAGPRGLTWRGAWSNTTAYAVNDAVQFNGTSYISLQPGTGHEPDTSPAFWSLLAQAGATGTAGTNGVNGSPGTAGTNGLNGSPGAQGIAGPQGLTWQGAWSNTTAYAVNDAVQFNGTSYISLQAGTGHEPDTSRAFWSLLALAGATGTAGTNGVNGSPGTAGTNGLNGSPGAQGIAGPQGLTWQGPWSNTIAYALNDAVQFDGTSYISLQPGTGHEPDTSPTFWSLLAQAGATGTAGTNGVNGSPGTAGVDGSPGTAGTNGLNGSPGAQGIAGPQGLTWQGTWSNTTAYAVNDAVQFDGTSYISLQPGIGHEPDTSPAFWSLLALAGATGAPGPGGLIAFADFYALMPPDNSATVAPATDVQFPQDGPTSGSAIVRTSASTFNLSAIGTYQVLFQVSVDEAGQLTLTLNGNELAYTAVGRATITSQIVGMSLVTTSVINSLLTVRNPAGNSTALTITPLAGGTSPVSAHLVITQIQ